MKPLPLTHFGPILATAIISFTLMSFASTVSAQAPGGAGARGPQTGERQIGEPEQKHERRQSRKAARMARLYDTNGDGKITIAEINADQARMFTALDVDGDKSMSVEEIRRRGRSLQIYRTTTLFDLLDTNGDGKLSVAEIQAPSKRWFKRYDENGNGILEADEIADSHHRGGRRGGRHGRRRGGHR